MKKLLLKNKLIIALSVLLFICSISLVFVLNGFKQVKADCLVDGTIEDEYFIGQELTVPSGAFEIDNSSVSANSQIILPDGTSVSTDKIALDQMGLYTIRYTANKDGKNYYDERQFNVFKHLYEVEGVGSVSYEAEEKFDGAKGLKLALADGDVFKLNKKLNLNDLFVENLPFIKFHITPERQGYAELDYIYVKVTDAYDSNKFFALELKYFPSNLWKSTQLGVLGCINNFGHRYYNDQICDVGLSAPTGWRPYVSFEGNTENNTLEEQAISFYYNSLTERIVGADLTGVQAGVLGLGSFPDVWEGFTNGDVYISVYGNSFRATKAHLFIDSIGNVDFNSNKLVDTLAPEITIDYDRFGVETYPNGYVNTAYPMFKASAFDACDGAVSIKKAVYYNYYSDSKVNIAVKDEKFTPTKTGLYTIVYTATDRFGNVANEYVDIQVLSSEEVPEFKYEVSGEYVDHCVVGDNVVLPTVTFSGEVGFFSSEVRIVKESKSFEEDIENGTIRVMEAGTYSVSFIATDFLNRNTVFNYTLNVSGCDVPLFMQDVESIIANNYIVGYSHKLPDIKAVFVNSDNSVVDVPVVISTDNGVISNGMYTPASKGDVSITVSATYNNKTNSVTLNKKAYVIADDNGIDMKSLWITSDNVISEYTADGFAEYKVTGTGKVEFLNKLLSENTSVKIQTDKEFNDVSEININLYNPINKQEFVQLKLKNFDGMAFVSVNGQEYQSVFQGDFSGDNSFDIKYVESTKSFTINGLTYAIETENGGLNSDYATLEIEVVGITDSSVYGLIVEKVGNQSMKNDSVIDISKPMIASLEDYGGFVEINSIYRTPKVVATDIISPELKSFTMTITAPDGTYACIDGVEYVNMPVKQVSLQLSQYGSYMFEYIAIDMSNRKETFRFAINVLDDVAPEVLIDGERYVSAKLNDVIKVANFSATDNCDAEDKLTKTVLVLNPKGVYELVSEKFTVNSKGRYTVYCYVTDTFGNVGLSYYVVEVV